MKIGLEKEFFLIQDNKPVVIPEDLQPDDSGLLTEARSQPFESPEEAVFSLQADIYKLQNKVNLRKMQLSDAPIMKIDRETRLLASRRFVKGLTKYQNLYDIKYHKNKLNEVTAGIHISFTSPKTYFDKNNQIGYYNSMFDWVQIFRKLDKEFELEIKTTKRNPGFYELKSDGRIEYRSLPSNINLNKIIEILRKII